MKNNYYKIEVRTGTYGKVSISASSNDLNEKELTFHLHESDSELHFIESYLGKKYLNQYAEGVTIFFVPLRTYKQAIKYPYSFIDSKNLIQ